MSTDTSAMTLRNGDVAPRSPEARRAPGAPLPHAGARPPSRRLVVALAATVAAAALVVAQTPPYRPGSALGYGLGLAGGSVMLALLLYPIRKHVRCLQEWGRLKHWFLAHMVGGVLGPVLVLFHSTFRVGSLNAGVALSCMLLVVASGLAGRFLYRRVHHGLYGRRATLNEARQALQQQMATLEPRLRATPELHDEVERFLRHAASEPATWSGRAAHFATLGWRRARTARRLRAMIRRLPLQRSARPDCPVSALVATVDDALGAAQAAAQFLVYERLFALWHVVHIPFLCLLVITAIIHVVAVHAY